MESDQIWNQVAKFMQQLRGENLRKNHNSDTRTEKC